ncbi:MAG: hypothetical protein ACTSV6_01725, partial [Candidatus Heimdallarchaeota archaeon]
MYKEMIFRLSSKHVLDTLLAELEEQIKLEKDSMDEGLGFSLRNADRSLHLQVFPMKEGELFEVAIKTNSKELEAIIKQVFNQPAKERIIDASFLDVVEFIAKLPDNFSHEELKQLLDEQFNLSEEKIAYFGDLILKQAKLPNAREEFKQAALHWR